VFRTFEPTSKDSSCRLSRICLFVCLLLGRLTRVPLPLPLPRSASRSLSLPASTSLPLLKAFRISTLCGSRCRSRTRTPTPCTPRLEFHSSDEPLAAGLATLRSLSLWLLSPFSLLFLRAPGSWLPAPFAAFSAFSCCSCCYCYCCFWASSAPACVLSVSGKNSSSKRLFALY